MDRSTDPRGVRHHADREPSGAGAPRSTRRALLARLGLLGLSTFVLPASLAGCAGTSGSDAGSAGAAPAVTGMSQAMPMPTAAPRASPPPAAPTASAANGGAPQPPNQVTIDNFAFRPATITVAAGTPVTWVNHDDVPHTVTSRLKGLFGSPALDTDQTFSFTFTVAGSYAYYCAIHPIMTGQVIVQ